MAKADEAASVHSPLLGAVPARRFAPQSAPRAAPLWSATPPLWGAMSPDPSLQSAPTSPPDDFWRLLPLAQGSRRNSTTAEGKLPAGQTPSWNASTPSPAETVKKSPLTPFPAWRDEPDGESRRSTGQPQQRHRDLEEQESVTPPINAGLVRHRWNLNTALHGAMLVGQCIVTLAVFSTFVAVLVWQKGNPRSGLGDSSLWNYLAPSLGLTLAVCVSVLVLHETRVLSTVAILYLQALILTMTTATSLALWIWILTKATSQMVKGLFVGCLIMMEGTAMLAFGRATLVWWLLEDRGELGGNGESVDQHVADWEDDER
ncbi:hypothetical protein HRG_007582 [Hirsutella rhossiliensis]|uniref:Uncharacterized protein n=1 Tax=Hirsutella rhossiliensis TaxID=111463 RepID=A0A9P8SGV7_9HYPO|nr:uncharacterized protein HRG_07582 [Hirsutella rhossiliensis]KAH0961504.1 hypothetical protein HRG_07582 [Hirsutella rhossiliensis]